MNNNRYFTQSEWTEFRNSYRHLVSLMTGELSFAGIMEVSQMLREAVTQGRLLHSKHGLNLIARNMTTALLLCEMVGVDRDMIL